MHHISSQRKGDTQATASSCGLDLADVRSSNGARWYLLAMSSSNVLWPAEDELRERLAVIEVAVANFPGTQNFEHLLRDLTALLGSAQLRRSASVPILVEWIATEPWPFGAEEALEFSMRQLQWPEMRSALEDMQQYASIRVRHNLSRVLEVYEPTWPGGEIYRTYEDS